MLETVDGVDKSFSRRLALNHAILKNKYWILPVDNRGHENYMPVGRGAVTSVMCGLFTGFNACTNVEGHKDVVIDGVDCTGKYILILRHLWCHKAECPVCFNRGFAVRGARSIESRVLTAEKRGLGSAEHITVSVPVADRELPVSVQRARALKALVDRGITWGCEIFHGFRADRASQTLKWSTHFHTLSHVPALQKCRECQKACSQNKGCGGFVDLNYRCTEKDGYIVKVHAKRKTIFGTAFYELNHATVHVGLKRSHITTWFGLLSTRNFRTERRMSENLCPVCREGTKRHFYVGTVYIPKKVGDQLYRPWVAVDPLDEDGKPTVIKVVGSRNG